MTWERDDNFNDTQIKGIDLTIKAISKKYPFIKGWEFIKDYQKWKAHLYINVIVDWVEVGEFYGKKLKPYWLEEFKNNKKIDSSLIDSYMFENPSHTDEGYQEFFNKAYKDTKQINTLLNSIYSSLPTEFQVMTTFKSLVSFIEDEVKPAEISIEHFVSGV